MYNRRGASLQPAVNQRRLRPLSAHTCRLCLPLMAEWFCVVSDHAWLTIPVFVNRRHAQPLFNVAWPAAAETVRRAAKGQGTNASRHCTWKCGMLCVALATELGVHVSEASGCVMVSATSRAIDIDIALRAAWNNVLRLSALWWPQKGMWTHNSGVNASNSCLWYDIAGAGLTRLHTYVKLRRTCAPHTTDPPSSPRMGADGGRNGESAHPLSPGCDSAVASYHHHLFRNQLPFVCASH